MPDVQVSKGAALLTAAIIVIGLAVPNPTAASPRALGGSAATALPPDQLAADPACAARTATSVRADEWLSEGGFTAARPARAALALEVVPTAGGAFLGQGSRITLSNERGVVHLRLRAGNCADPDLSLVGGVAQGDGTWEVAESTEAFAGASGSGTFTMASGTRRGADNSWQVDLDGPLAVPQPTWQVRLVRSTWAHLGAGYAGRVATVVIDVRNVGGGGAYDAVLAQVTTRNPNVHVVELSPAAPVVHRPGESAQRTVRVKVNKTTDKGPLLFGQVLPLSFHVTATDAFDLPANQVIDLDVTAPRFPPAL